MDERYLDLQQEQLLGQRAEELMSALEPYFMAMEDKLVIALKSCGVADVNTLQNIKLQLHAVDCLKKNIDSVINTGKLAAVEIGNRDE